MKKLWLILIILALLMTGCAETLITCGIDAEKNAYLSIDFGCQWGDVDETEANELQTGFQILAAHYRDKLGFTVEEAYTNTGCTLRAAMIRPAESDEEAFRELEAMLRDESITPFVEVHTENTAQGNIEGYAISLTLDAGNVLSNLGVEELPGDLQQYFRQSIEGSTAELSVSLPASEMISGPAGATCADGMAEASAKVDLTGQTTLNLSTLVFLEDGQVVSAPQKGLEDTITRLERERQLLTWVLIGAVTLILVFAVILIISRRRSAVARRQALACDGASLEPDETVDIPIYQEETE